MAELIKKINELVKVVNALIETAEGYLPHILELYRPGACNHPQQYKEEGYCSACEVLDNEVKG